MKRSVIVVGYAITFINRLVGNVVVPAAICVIISIFHDAKVDAFTRYDDYYAALLLVTNALTDAPAVSVITSVFSVLLVSSGIAASCAFVVLVKRRGLLTEL